MSKEEIKLQLIAAPSFLLIGLGIFSISAPDPSVVHPILASSITNYLLFLAGGIGAVMSIVKAIHIFKNR